MLEVAAATEAAAVGEGEYLNPTSVLHITCLLEHSDRRVAAGDAVRRSGAQQLRSQPAGAAGGDV